MNYFVWLKFAPVKKSNPSNSSSRSGFTLLELMVVVTIIGILAGLAYSSLVELIFANRAKETAQTMRTFVERALAESKRKEKTVTISLDLPGGKIKANWEADNKEEIFELLSGDFNKDGSAPLGCVDAESSLVQFNEGADSEPKIGISSIALKDNPEQNEGYFIACGAKGYCAAAVKVSTQNSFVACVKKGNNANWEML
ncbi:MAG: prepilin-type N-terminal cleavage/methylation domain-containing protein [Fibromonadaceae bacterium]|jgi:prepilin-type N-terminal cleavage/methylation domain-containing protein|nr:prepilin-type N-terminal cleavage/methylation domain-containing protein [Fibromonadaceae bacterium]